MKLTLLLAFVAVTASVAYAAPQGDDEEIAIQEFLEKALKQSPQDHKDVDIQDFLGSMQQEDDKNVDIQDFLANMQQDKEGVETQDLQDLLGSMQEDDEEAELQEFFAKEQIPAHMQGWWRRAWRTVKRVARKVAPYVRHGIRIYKAYRRYRG